MNTAAAKPATSNAGDASPAFAIGHIAVKDEAKWAEYRSQVPATIAPWGGELVFRGKLLAVLAGEHRHTDTVVLKFPNAAALAAWHGSAAYQALVPLREQAADVVLLGFET